MGVISLYSRLYDGVKLAKQPVLPTPLEQIDEGFKLLEDANDITLAEYDRNTKDIITAHKMKDYRRKRFNLILLPNFHSLFDDILEGSEYWSALLHDESPYT